MSDKPFCRREGCLEQDEDEDEQEDDDRDERGEEDYADEDEGIHPHILALAQLEIQCPIVGDFCLDKELVSIVHRGKLVQGFLNSLSCPCDLELPKLLLDELDRSLVVLLVHDLAAFRALEVDLDRLLKGHARAGVPAHVEEVVLLAGEALVELVHLVLLDLVDEVGDVLLIEVPVTDVPALDLVLLPREGDDVVLEEAVEYVSGLVDLLVKLFCDDELADMLLALDEEDERKGLFSDEFFHRILDLFFCDSHEYPLPCSGLQSWLQDLTSCPG